MLGRQYLQIPGPTNVPDRILRELSRPLINHRGPEFEKLLSECIEGLKKVFRTNNDILLFPSSGSGILESAVVNLFNTGDTIAVSSIGVFSERMAAIAEKHGLKVIRIEKEWGEAVTKDDVKEVLLKDAEKVIKAVCLPQNETTSGVTDDIKGVSEAIKELNHPALLIVDAVSSLGSIELETDLWNVDIVVAGSQKGLMLPPGLGIVSVSPKAWEAYEKSNMPRWYWDYGAVRDKLSSYQLPYTPPTTLLFGLREALKMIEEEGLENIWARHDLMAKAVRNSARAMGLEVLADEENASSTVTAIKLPEKMEYKALSNLLREKYNVVIGGGLGKLKGKIFRVGHLGSIDHLDVYATMGAVEMALYELGYNVKLGSASKAVAETFLLVDAGTGNLSTHL